MEQNIKALLTWLKQWVTLNLLKSMVYFIEVAQMEICQKLESVNIGEPRMLLRVQVERDSVTISIRIYQEQYVLKILRNIGMEDCTPGNTLLPPRAIYTKADENEIFEDSIKYRAAIGSLMFASVVTRPDITYSKNLRDIMEELTFKHYEPPIPLFMDSDGAVVLTKNPENVKSVLHIDKVYHWIRQHVEEIIQLQNALTRIDHKSPKRWQSVFTSISTLVKSRLDSSLHY